MGTNDNWGSAPNAASTLASTVGAFSLTNGSNDAAFVKTLSSGIYGLLVTGNGGGTGNALVEVYDGNTSGSSPKLAAISTRCQVTSSDPMIAGFVIDGSEHRRMLIRGVGPELANQGVSGYVTDPKITLYHNGNAIYSNDDWGSAANSAEIASVASSVGAFALTASSADSAMLLHLPPGVYGAVVETKSGTGIALAEVYLAD